MAKPTMKREFSNKMSGTINSVKDKNKESTKNLRGKVYFEDENTPINFVGVLDDSNDKKLTIDFDLFKDDKSDVFATQIQVGSGELVFNKYRNSEKAPDWRSSDPFKVDGKSYRMSCWTRESKGGKFLSVAIQSEDEYQSRIAASTGNAPVQASSVSADEAGI